MPDQDPVRRSVFWTWVRAVSYSLPWWIAALSAYFSQEAAFRVFQTESKRLAFETTRYTHETYRDYIKFRREDSNKNLTACFRPLVSVADRTSRDYLLTDDELTWMFAPASEYVFRYDKARHAGLAVCIGEEKLKSLVEKGMPGASDEQTDSLKRMKEAIYDKVVTDIAVLDAALVGYAHEKADKTIICENFAGFLQTQRQLKDPGYGVYGTFLLRLIHREMLRPDNYPNLFRFTDDLSAISAKFTKSIDCAKLPQRPLRDPGRMDWIRAMLGL